MEVPELIRLDAVPGGIGVIRQQVVDGGGGRTFDGRAIDHATLDALLAAIGLAVEAAFRMRREAEAGDEALGCGRDRHGEGQSG
jgi:hypothetical protein